MNPVILLLQNKLKLNKQRLHLVEKETTNRIVIKYKLKVIELDILKANFVTVNNQKTLLLEIRKKFVVCHPSVL